MIAKKWLDQLPLPSETPVFIHSDLKFGLPVDLKLPGEEYLQGHIQHLGDLFPKRQLMMPSFNYEFSKTKVFDLSKTPTNVGVLNEYFRNNISEWRIPIPVFSVNGTGTMPKLNDEAVINPLGTNSIFANLVETNALIVHYGSRLLHTTLMHHLEELMDVPYHFVKHFEGELQNEGDLIKKLVVEYKVRPLTLSLEKDWAKIEADLKSAGLFHEYRAQRTYILALSARELFQFWKQKLLEDKLYFLTADSRTLTEELLLKLGRPFVQKDFEVTP